MPTHLVWQGPGQAVQALQAGARAAPPRPATARPPHAERVHLQHASNALQLVERKILIERNNLERPVFSPARLIAATGLAPSCGAVADSLVVSQQSFIYGREKIDKMERAF